MLVEIMNYRSDRHVVGNKKFLRHSTKMSSASDVIYPPADIKGVIDKTAEFVAKVGEDFEKKVAMQQSGQPKFAFLNVGNPYRKYYELRVKELREGKESSGPVVPKALQDMKQVEEEKRRKRQERKMLADGLVKEYPPPPPNIFSLDHPFIAPVDSEIIKITAQFVAKNGVKFVQGLMNRESRNPQFAFVKTDHELYPYFQALVESYRKVLLPPPEEKTKIASMVESLSYILERIRNRYHYMAQEEKRQADKTKYEVERKEAMSRIDWFNFTVVGTLDFPEDENIRLEVPIDPLTGRRNVVGLPAPMSAGIIVSSDDMQPETKQSDELEEEILMEGEVKQEEDSLPPIQPSVQIRTDYVRAKKTDKPETYVKCPITGEMVREADFSEHMRVVLLDPQWKKQSEIVMKRAREEASALAEDIGDNVADFIKKRIDLFGQPTSPKRSRTAQ
jgi:splicing factor 3A subunit 1